MSNFDLDSYETVKERKKKFKADYPDGRIVVEQINLPEQIKELAEFKAYLFKDADEQSKNLPLATGHALEIRETELSRSRDGKTYESVNYTSWTENAEESAVGRALDNAGYAGAPSREEMKKVIRHAELLTKEKSAIEKPIDNGWRNGRPGLTQIKAAINVAAYKGDIERAGQESIEQGKKLGNEMLTWTAGTVSDYIGNKITLEEARKKAGEKAK